MASTDCASNKGNASPPAAEDATAPQIPSQSAGVELNTSEPAADVFVQYVVLRRDLWRDLGWPLGSIMAQVRCATELLFKMQTCLFLNSFVGQK